MTDAALAHQRWRTPDSFAWLAIGLAPVLLGLLTWDTETRFVRYQNWIRFTGAPVAGVELLVLLLALRQGFEPFRTMRKMPAWAQAAIRARCPTAGSSGAVVRRLR